MDQVTDNPSFKNLTRGLLDLSQAKDMVSLDNFSGAQIPNWGYIIYQKIWKDSQLDKILNKLTGSRKIQSNLNEASLLMVIQHLLKPKNKLGTYNR